MRLDGYIRVSRVGAREGEGYISPDVQRQAIERYADELGGSIVHWGDDQDYSGGNIDRPGFQVILDRLERGETDGIVVMKVDRFARGVADGVRIVREIVDRDQVFAACQERIDPRTPEGRYMLTSFFANAELFLDQKKADWWTAKTRAIARGVPIGPAQIGYRKEKSSPLEPDPVMGPAITELFRRAGTGQFTDAALARWWNEAHPHPSGRRWNQSELRRWLRNRVYLGEIRYAHLVNTEAHEPLTDIETWERCQRPAGEQRRAPSPFLLRGMIRCANCRYSMGGQTGGGSKGETPVYRCYQGCESPSTITAAVVEDYVVALLKKGREREVQKSAADPDLARLEREAAEAIAEVDAFVGDLEIRRLVGDEAWRKGVADRVADRDVKVAARDDGVREVADRERLGRIEELDRHDLRDLLAGSVQHVFVRRAARGAPAAERVRVVWAREPVVAVPGPHRSGPFDPVVWD